MVNIVVAFPKKEDIDTIKNILVRKGYNVIATATTGARAIQLVSYLNEAILISSYSFPDMHYLQIRQSLDCNINMILITRANQVLEIPDENTLLLVLPLKVHALLESINIISVNLERIKKKKKNFKNEKDKKLIEKAKDILMDRNNMTEEQAHRYLQKTSMNKSISMVELSLMILGINE